jgi:hypothetical protein
MRRMLAIPLIILAGLGGCLRWNTGRQARLISVDAQDLSSTLVTADLQEPIVEGTSVIWCGTIQLAWNELLDAVGQDIVFLDMAEQPAVLTSLNQRLITTDDLDEASYVAMAGMLRDGIVDQIQQTMAQKFPDVTPNLPVPEGADPRSIVAYSYLFKNLLFPQPFERLNDPIVFDGQHILCFGLSGDSVPSAELLNQVSILDYQSDDDFVIELKTRNEADQVIMAKVQPQATLKDTIEGVLARSAQDSGEHLNGDDVLKVPMINFDLRRSYDELVGHEFLAANGVTDPYVIEKALQSIRFELNEAGVQLRSEVFIFVGVTSIPPQPRRLIFDKPFLFMMKLRDADLPYFAMWIDNPELLGKADE